MTDEEWIAAKPQIIAVLKRAYYVFDPYDWDYDNNGFSHYNRAEWEALPMSIRELVEPKDALAFLEDDDDDEKETPQETSV